MFDLILSSFWTVHKNIQMSRGMEALKWSFNKGLLITTFYCLLQIVHLKFVQQLSVGGCFFCVEYRQLGVGEGGGHENALQRGN